MNTTSPLVSICIPTYNGRQFIKECLTSAIGQSYKNIEIIFLDDGSTDDTYNTAAAYAEKDSRIKLFRNEKNLGLVSNWNKCIEYANGEWIKFLFQDDVLEPDCIEVMLNALTDEDRIVVSARKFLLDESADEATRKHVSNEILTFERLGVVAQSPIFIPAGKIAALVAGNICINFIGEPTVIMFKKEMTKELGVFNPDLVQICDLEYFLRIACNYGIKYVPRPLAYFRVHKNSTTQSNLSEKMFSMLYIDPVVMAHELLYGTSFKRFRGNLSMALKVKLRLFFEVRVNESYENSIHSKPENLEKFKVIAKKYPAIEKYSRGTFLTRILLGGVRMRRSLR